MNTSQIIFILIGFFFFFLGYINKKLKKMKREGAFLSYTIGFFMIVISLFPSITAFIGRIFGVKNGIDFIVYGSITLLFYLTLIMYSKIEENKRQITKLVRMQAINDTLKEDKR